MRPLVRLNIDHVTGTGHFFRMRNLFLDCLDQCVFAIQTDRPDNPLFAGTQTVFLNAETDVASVARAWHCDLIVVDLLHYGPGMIEILRGESRRPIVTFHEDANFSLASDLCVNYNFFEGWRGFQSTRILAGPRYIVFHPDLNRRLHRGTNLFVSFGGSDPGGYTSRFIDECAARIQMPIIVHTGPFFGSPLAQSPPNVQVVQNPQDLYSLMGSASLAVCSGGQTMYELMFLGIPCLVLPQNRHQWEFAVNAEKEGLCQVLGTPRDLDFGEIPRMISELSHKAYSPRTRIDGLGGSRIRERIAELVQSAV